MATKKCLGKNMRDNHLVKVDWSKNGAILVDALFLESMQKELRLQKKIIKNQKKEIIVYEQKLKDIMARVYSL